jgi:hypothetical protein
MGGTARPFGSHATQGGDVTRLLLYINRRSGVAHVDRFCDAIGSVPARYLRLEPYDPARPRRFCSRCWEGGCPRSRAFAGSAGSVTEQGAMRSGRSGLVAPDLVSNRRLPGSRKRASTPGGCCFAQRSTGRRNSRSSTSGATRRNGSQAIASSRWKAIRHAAGSLSRGAWSPPTRKCFKTCESGATSRPRLPDLRGSTPR